MVGADRSAFRDHAHRKPQATSALSMNVQAQQDQLAALRQFVAQVGGLENARKALELLASLNSCD
jgi:hypothetical protein